ncbi:Prolyl 4-hydroxylase subunit alpha-1 [Hondaea fermentalgiana]|uniref:Prolyl 4-hydroxylase subunit alpha-1 n=1 Tax=Hondaea fermentalgiana TaxID=2315210 RepID=A0A2R5G440_9STRA|nr:Prolyl 4-hydroxylase subunit alpha-1 [Hondaea fermentalgiana]|eukprot:GBG25796.1 Prolyl 4-hydroxylase subunit alpha-1 [Hondaea fermentalgiana]
MQTLAGAAVLSCEQEKAKRTCDDEEDEALKELQEMSKAWLTSTLTRLATVAASVLILVVAIAIGMSEEIQNDLKNIAREVPLPRTLASYDQHHAEQDDQVKFPVDFTVHFNGDGLGDGMSASSRDWTGIDPLIRAACDEMEEVLEFASYDNETMARICEPTRGARLFTPGGKRVRSFADVPANGTRIYLVPQGLQFVFPLGKVGTEIVATNVVSPLADKVVKLRQLTESPRVFSLENFISDEEIDAILKHNADLVKPSEVGFSGWRDSTRTSSTAWDMHSSASRAVRRRSFDLLGMDFDNDMADALQVLRYNLSEWYKPHLDSFDKKAYDGTVPKVENGTNRFATIFLYLSDVEEGGHTVFPLSTTHEGYNGEKIVHDGTVRSPGYIADKDARWACNTSSTALRSGTRRGSALLFYSQTADGEIDPYSLHGGCPVVKGIKYSANVWVWNRPKPSKSDAKDAGARPAPDLNSIQMHFHNRRAGKVNLFWDDGTEDMIFQAEILPGEMQSMTTYHGHSFVVRDADSKETLHAFTANDKLHKGKQHVEAIEA